MRYYFYSADIYDSKGNLTYKLHSLVSIGQAGTVEEIFRDVIPEEIEKTHPGHSFVLVSFNQVT